MSLYIASLAEIKTELGIASDDTGDDALVTSLIERLQGAFDSRARRRFAAADGAVETFTGGDAAIWIKRSPVHSVVSILSDGDSIDSDSYVGPSPHGRLYWKNSPCRWPGNEIVVTFNGGIFSANGSVSAAALAADPNVASDAADLRRAFFMQVSFEWRNRMTLGNASISGGGQSVTLAPAKMLPEVAQTLKEHCLIA